MKVLGKIRRMLPHALVGRFGVKPIGMSPRGWYRRSCLGSCVLTGLLGVLLVSGASAASKLARGEMSPFKGNAYSDLVTVTVYMVVNTWNLEGQIFDNGSIVVANSPPNGKGKKPCGEDAAECVCAPGMWIVKPRLGKGRVMQGNEVSYFSTLMYAPVPVMWQRLPGPLVVRFYVKGYPLSGMGSGVAESDEVGTTAGSSYDFVIGWERVQGGLELKIRAGKLAPPPFPRVPAPPPPPPPPVPTVTLTAEPSTIAKGQSVTLKWSSQYATDLDLEPGVGKVRASGSSIVTPQDSTTFKITATGPAGIQSATARVTVTVPPPP